MKKQNELQTLFEELAELLNIPTKGTLNKKTPTNQDFYKEKFLIIEYASVYGGYRLEYVHPSTAHSFFSFAERLTKKEMIIYIKGLIKGLTK